MKKETLQNVFNFFFPILVLLFFSRDYILDYVQNNILIAIMAVILVVLDFLVFIYYLRPLGQKIMNSKSIKDKIYLIGIFVIFALIIYGPFLYFYQQFLTVYVIQTGEALDNFLKSI